ncbi:hypothetical protein CQA53_04425 [Helicobacter didelphidarum]|uniref:Uncharacterized protein n=1 Tax=Helicobacter didelphidarum TaxID=2040648 RepID=A0A3D8ILZ7_9HELI|nr:hypothetical protein [Helicobacter didelphidarum]RDU66258.1 hypothetical protein CQA53_04425 [Helicobacter didelphidarum]
MFERYEKYTCRKCNHDEIRRLSCTSEEYMFPPKCPKCNIDMETSQVPTEEFWEQQKILEKEYNNQSSIFGNLYNLFMKK